MIFILSGPSGSGKTTLRDLLFKDKTLKKKGFVKAVSLTTRPKRDNEKEGRDYFFVSKKKFFSLRKEGKILEWTRYLGYYYATKKEVVEEAIRKKKNVLLCLDFKGAMYLKKRYPKEVVTIFVGAPSLEELKRRISGRCKYTTHQEIGARIKLAQEELKNKSYYDYCLDNRDLTEAVKRLKRIMLKQLIKKEK